MQKSEEDFEQVSLVQVFWNFNDVKDRSFKISKGVAKES